jgi:hypothetical protein
MEGEFRDVGVKWGRGLGIGEHVMRVLQGGNEELRKYAGVLYSDLNSFYLSM